jgi:cell division septum initiation protein DivIVA
MEKDTLGPVSISVDSLLDALHSKYGSIIAQLMQESAEQSATIKQLRTQVSEQQSMAAALQMAGQ